MAFGAIRKTSSAIIGAALTPLWVGLASLACRGVLVQDPSFEGDKTAYVVEGAARDTTLAFKATRDTFALGTNVIGCAVNSEAPLMDKIQSRDPYGQKYSKGDCVTASILEWKEDLSVAWREYNAAPSSNQGLRGRYNHSSGAGYGSSSVQSLEVNGQKYQNDLNSPRHSAPSFPVNPH